MSRLVNSLAASLLCNGLVLLLVPVNAPIPLAAIVALTTALLCALLWPHRLLGPSNRQLHRVLFCFTSLLLLAQLRTDSFSWTSQQFLAPVLISLPLILSAFALSGESVVRIAAFAVGFPISAYAALTGVPGSFNPIASGEVIALTLVAAWFWRPSEQRYGIARLTLIIICTIGLIRASSLGPIVSAALALLFGSRYGHSRSERRSSRFTRTRKVIAGAAVMASLYLLLIELAGGVTLGGNNSDGRRRAIEAVFASPTWFGHGFTPIQLSSGGEIPYAHNLPADVLWSTGVFGLIIAVVTLAPLLRRFFTSPEPHLMPLAVVIFQAMFSSAALGNFTFWLALGLIAAEYGKSGMVASIAANQRSVML
jgi:hypothetical protein